METTMVSRTLSVHKEHELLLKLEAAGLSDELAQRVIDSKGNDLAINVVRLIQNSGFEVKCARKTRMNFFDAGRFSSEEDEEDPDAFSNWG